MTRIAIAILALLLLGFMQIDSSQPIWTHCDIRNVDGVVFLNERYVATTLYDTPGIWVEGAVSYDLPTITAVTQLEGVHLDWNSTDGFAIYEIVDVVGWQILLRGDAPITWAQWWRGRETNDFYVLATDDMNHYVADYGGSDSWHVRCGGWIVEG